MRALAYFAETQWKFGRQIIELFDRSFESSQLLNDDQAFCVQRASCWMRNDGPNYMVDIWLLAASCPKLAKKLRDSGFS